MRVISGRWRGRKLKSPTGQEIRPTTDRVKEAMFSMLGPSVTEALVVDLCCGAGGLGIEALSRGARQVIMVDTAVRSLELARANLQLCGAEPDQFQLVQATAEAWLQRWRPPDDVTALHILADPPYQSGARGVILSGMVELAGTPAFATAVLEHGDDFEPVLPGGAPVRLETRRYGTSRMTVLRPIMDISPRTGES